DAASPAARAAAARRRASETIARHEPPPRFHVSSPARLPFGRPGMLSYQHEYHAGNHADVVKHAVLALLIEALQRKPSPLRVLDAHAGSGVYDLDSPEAQRAR